MVNCYMAESEGSDGVSATVTSDSPRQIETKLAVDLISSLPDELLHHIFSFFPTRQAITTSVLSKRWSHVWSEAPCLDFVCHGLNAASINKTLSNYSSNKIKTFKLIIFPDVSPTQINTWIEFGMSRNPEELSIRLMDSRNYTFPDSFFINSSIQHLTLYLCHSGTIPECNVSWTSLKMLSLNWCKLPDESITAILTGCPMLETLILNFCAELRILNLRKFVKLTRLEIQSPNQGVLIVAPHVRYLIIANCHMDTTLANVSSLTEAKFNLPSNIGGRFLDYNCLQDKVLKMLAKLQNVEKLTLGPVVLQILSLAEIRGVAFPELKTKDLTVEMMLVRSFIPGLIMLLQNTPALKKITVYTTKIGNILRERELNIYLMTQRLNPRACWDILFPTDENTYEFSMCNAFAENAKFIYVLRFMEIVLCNAKTVEAMVLRLEGYLNADEYQRMLPKLRGKATLSSFKIIP